MVDEVVVLIDIQASRIEPAPSFGTNAVDGDFTLGVGKADKRVIFLLHIRKLMTEKDVLAMPEM